VITPSPPRGAAGRSDAVAAGWGCLPCTKASYSQCAHPLRAQRARLSQRESKSRVYRSHARHSAGPSHLWPFASAQGNAVADFGPWINSLTAGRAHTLVGRGRASVLKTRGPLGLRLNAVLKSLTALPFPPFLFLMFRIRDFRTASRYYRALECNPFVAKNTGRRECQVKFIHLVATEARVKHYVVGWSPDLMLWAGLPTGPPSLRVQGEP